MGRPPPNSALAFSGHVQNTCPSAPPLGEPENACELSNPAQCDLTTGVPAYPREPGENLFCYYQRLFNLVFAGGTPSEFLSKFLNLSELTDVEAARANLGLGDGSPAAGELLIGNGTDFSLATLTPGSGVAITNNNGEIIISAVGGGAASVIISPTPPGSAVDGDLWWDNTIGQLKIYYTDANSSQWVDAAGSGGADVGVVDVTASSPLASSGGASPNISLTGVVPIANGGTGGNSDSAARTNLGLGTVLTDISDLRTDVSNNTNDISILRGDVDALGTLSLQDADTVAITGGSAVLDAANITLLALPPELGYGTSGTVDLRFDLASNAYIGIAGNITFTASGMASGRTLVLNLKNTTGGAVTLAWPAWNVASGTLPTSLAAGEAFCVRAEAYGNTNSTVFADGSSFSGSFGTLALQDADAVAITGGSAVLEAANIGLLGMTPELGYGTSGVIDLRFDLTTNVYIGLAGSATFTASGMASGRMLVVNLRNTTGATISLSWPGWYPSGSTFPSTLGANESLCVRAEAYGASITDVYAQCVSFGSNDLQVFNVREYGAVGDGSTNDAAAFSAAIDDINALGRGQLYVPQGRYRIASTLSTFEVPASVVGHGVEVTDVYFDGVIGFKFDFSGASAHRTVTVSDLTISTPNGSTRRGLHYIPGTSGSALEKSFSFSRLQFSGGWTYAIDVDSGALNRIQGASIEDVTILGDIGDTTPAAIGIRISNATLVQCSKIIGYWLDKGVLFTGDSEGLLVDGFTFAACTYGIYVAGSATCSDFHFNRGFCNILSGGVGVVLGDGTGNVVGGDVTEVFLQGNSGALKGILSYARQANISDFNITGFVTGIECNNYASDEYNSIHDGYIADATNAVALGTNVTYCRVHDVLTANISSTRFIDNGSNNVIGDARGFTNSYTLAGGSPTETVNLDISLCNLAAKSPGGVVQVTSDQAVSAQYDWDDGGNTALNARIRFFRYDGANLGTGPYRISARFGP